MCGLFGWDLTQTRFGRGKLSTLASLLAAYNDDRGGQSWGVYDGQKTTKGLGKIAARSLWLARLNRFFAHTRFATHGATTVANAHPFEIGRIIGAHNGVLSNHAALNAKYNRTFEVDSQHLFAHLDAGLPFGDIEGYGSITWIDRLKPDRLYMCRMRGGVLAVARVIDAQGKEGTVWSSDADALKVALRAARLKYQKYILDEGRVYFVSQGKLFVTTDSLKPSAPVVVVDWRKGYANARNTLDRINPCAPEQRTLWGGEDEDAYLDWYSREMEKTGENPCADCDIFNCDHCNRWR